MVSKLYLLSFDKFLNKKVVLRNVGRPYFSFFFSVCRSVGHRLLKNKQGIECNKEERKVLQIALFLNSIFEKISKSRFMLECCMSCSSTPRTDLCFHLSGRVSWKLQNATLKMPDQSIFVNSLKPSTVVLFQILNSPCLANYIRRHKCLVYAARNQSQ